MAVGGPGATSESCEFPGLWFQGPHHWGQSQWDYTEDESVDSKIWKYVDAAEQRQSEATGSYDWLRLNWTENYKFRLRIKLCSRDQKQIQKNSIHHKKIRKKGWKASERSGRLY